MRRNAIRRLFPVIIIHLDPSLMQKPQWTSLNEWTNRSWSGQLLHSGKLSVDVQLGRGENANGDVSGSHSSRNWSGLLYFIRFLCVRLRFVYEPSGFVSYLHFLCWKIRTRLRIMRQLIRTCYRYIWCVGSSVSRCVSLTMFDLFAKCLVQYVNISA